MNLKWVGNRKTSIICWRKGKWSLFIVLNEHKVNNYRDPENLPGPWGWFIMSYRSLPLRATHWHKLVLKPCTWVCSCCFVFLFLNWLQKYTGSRLTKPDLATVWDIVMCFRSQWLEITFPSFLLSPFPNLFHSSFF